MILLECIYAIFVRVCNSNHRHEFLLLWLTMPLGGNQNIINVGNYCRIVSRMCFLRLHFLFDYFVFVCERFSTDMTSIYILLQL